MIAAWCGLPLVIIVYVWLRYWETGPAADVMAQVVYLMPPILGAGLSLSAAWLATPRTRAKTVWGLLACAISLMFVSEAYFSWTHLAHAPASMRDNVFDAVNASAFLLLLAMLCVAAGVDRLGLNRAFRLLLDVMALVTLVLVLLLRLWLWDLLGGANQSEALRTAAYVIGGLLLFGLNSYVFLTMPTPMRSRSWSLHLLGGIAIYSAALVMWPWWSFAVMGLAQSVLMEATTACLFLVGYYMVFLSGLARVTGTGQPWERLLSRAPIEISAWLGVAVAGGVLVAVIALGWASYTSPEQSSEQSIYLLSLMVATVCMVGRTALTVVETDTLRSRLTADATTGASNPRGFQSRVTRDVSLARRFGDRIALLVIDLDDFAVVATAHGRQAADGALVAVAGALKTAFPPPSEIYRLSSDEFAAIVKVSDRDEAHAVAEKALAAVRTVLIGGDALSASVGFALCPDDAAETATLVRHADIAVAWAKRHGKARVAGYDHKVAAALGSDADEFHGTLADVGPDVARALIAATDARGRGDYEHSRGVAALACLLAEDLAIESDRIERLRLAATLHDVGRIGLPDHPSTARLRSISETSPLDLRAHCDLGWRMLHAARLDDVALWVRHHHEHWDGSGYPDGLAGESIPLESRIISIADTYERLTNGHRPRGPMSKAAALQEIDQAISSQFDPELAERFIRVIGTTEALGWSDEWPAA